LAAAKARVSRGTHLPPEEAVAAVKAAAGADAATVAGAVKVEADAAKVAAGFAETGSNGLSSLEQRKRRRLNSASPPCRRD
jgi:hypothetical protein